MDWWKRDHLGDEPYQHVIGFSVEEGRRILRDSSYTGHFRTARYPLAHEWSWTRAETIGYLHEIFEVAWPRSCCVMCPFSHADPEGLTDRWRAAPEHASLSLEMEIRSITLNPRSLLFGVHSAWTFAIEHGLTDVLNIAADRLRRGPWAVYEVRRIYRARKDACGRQDPARKGIAWRSVQTLAEGTRGQMHTALRQQAERQGRRAWADEHGITRAQITALGESYPASERFLAVGPAGVRDKERPGFAALWSELNEQMALFSR